MNEISHGNDAGALQLDRLLKLYPVRGSLWDGLTGRKPKAVHAVDSVSFSFAPRSITAIVGESGCGKSTLAKLLALYERPTSGTFTYRGTPIQDWSRSGARAFRRQVQMVFQDPYESLNPRLTVGETCVEPLKLQRIGESDQERSTLVLDTLRFVGLNPPGDFVDKFPHELSGGQRQRVAIARAMVLNPDVIIADEPVSMLDVSLRAGILELFERWRDERGATIVFITHDVALARHISEWIAVMYLGEIVESGRTEEVIGAPQHPYTQALISAVPSANPFEKRTRTTLGGDVPSPVDLPTGCRFASRCPVVMPVCRTAHPDTYRVGDAHGARCFIFDKEVESTDDT